MSSPPDIIEVFDMDAPPQETMFPLPPEITSHIFSLESDGYTENNRDVTSSHIIESDDSYDASQLSQSTNSIASTNTNNTSMHSTTGHKRTSHDEASE